MSQRFDGSLATATLTPTTIYRGGIYVGKSTSLTMGQTAASLEIDNDEIRLAYTSTNGAHTLATLMTNPIQYHQYNLQLYWKPSANAAGRADVFAYSQDTGDTLTFRSRVMGGENLYYGSTTGTYVTGLAAWTDSGGYASDYSIGREYFAYRN